MRHKCGDYEIIFDEKTGTLRALRHGVEWRDLIGDGMVLSMLMEIDDLKNIIKGSMPRAPVCVDCDH